MLDDCQAGEKQAQQTKKSKITKLIFPIRGTKVSVTLSAAARGIHILMGGGGGTLYHSTT